MPCVLAAVDLSKEAIKVIQAAVEQARLLAVTAQVVHIIEDYEPEFFGISARPLGTSEIVKKKIEERLTELIEKAGVGELELILAEGHPVDELLALTEKMQCQTLVIGSHGRHGFQRLLGGTAFGIVHHANCNVFVVQLKQEWKSK